MSKCKVLLAVIGRYVSDFLFVGIASLFTKYAPMLAKAISFALLLAAVFMVGLGIGLCVNVFMARGVPVINGGGELLLLFLTPCTFYLGYRLGGSRAGATDAGETNADAGETIDTSQEDGANDLCENEAAATDDTTTSEPSAASEPSVTSVLNEASNTNIEVKNKFTGGRDNEQEKQT